MDESSGFFTMPSMPSNPEYSKLVRIGGNGNGYCELFKTERSGRFLVLKCLKEGYRGEPLYESLLKKEFEIGYSLSHHNICQYFDFREVEGLGHCIEMEWVDGRTLEEALASGKMEKSVSDKVLDELCDALSYMHSKQVFHRDLKPSNILLTYSGDIVKLIDFGLSDSDSHSVLKEPAGTAVFSAPEALEGGKADARSDIYSLGLVMYNISGHYRRVARKCCEKRPANRYQNIAQVKKALHSNAPLVSGILFIATIALLAILSLLPGSWLGRESVSQPAAATEISDTVSDQSSATKDTVAQVKASTDQVKPSGQTKTAEPDGASAKKATKPAVKQSDASAIDEIFRQATEMFDE